MTATTTKKDDNENGNNEGATAAAAAAADDDDDDDVITTTTPCTPDQFINAFNKQRTVLAGFAHCTTIEELHIVRDGFILGLAKDICPDQYKSVLILILRKQFATTSTSTPQEQKQEQEQQTDTSNNNVIHIPPETTTTTTTKTTENGIENDHGMLSMSFEGMVLAARICDDENNNRNDVDDNAGKSSCKKDDDSSTAAATTAAAKNTACYWNDLIKSVKYIATSVGSDLDSIWNTLENGRMVWIRAVNAAHPIKLILKHALEENNTENSPGDVSDAMMVWIYCLCINLVVRVEVSISETETESSTVDETLILLKNDVNQWIIAVNIKDKYNPLQGYQSELWDPRIDEWRSLDIGAQDAAERGGTTLFDAWNA